MPTVNGCYPNIYFNVINSKVSFRLSLLTWGDSIEARRTARGIERTVLFKLVSPNEFLCLEIVLSFCWKLFHSTGIVEAFVRSNYRVRNSKSGGGTADWLVLADIVCNDLAAGGRPCRAKLSFFK